jgi:hypothetical protein
MKYIAVIAQTIHSWLDWKMEYLNNHIANSYSGHYKVVNEVTNETFFYVNGDDLELHSLRGFILSGAIELCGLSNKQRLILNSYLNRFEEK